MVASALHRAEDALFARVAGRLPAEVVARILVLVADVVPEVEDADEDDRSLLALIKADPASVSLESMLTEIDRLLAVRAIELPAALFADVEGDHPMARSGRGGVPVASAGPSQPGCPSGFHGCGTRGSSDVAGYARLVGRCSRR